MSAQVTIFDTTLRDGEQSPGCSMLTPEKVRMALQLEKLGVDIIEGGFPIASAGDFEAVQAISEAVRWRFTGVIQAPASTAPITSSMPSARLSSRLATWSPGRTPASWRSQFARRVVRSASAAQPSRRAPSSSARPSGSRTARSKSIGRGA